MLWPNGRVLGPYRCVVCKEDITPSKVVALNYCTSAERPVRVVSFLVMRCQCHNTVWTIPDCQRYSFNPSNTNVTLPMGPNPIAVNALKQYNTPFRQYLALKVVQFHIDPSEAIDFSVNRIQEILPTCTSTHLPPG